MKLEIDYEARAAYLAVKSDVEIDRTIEVGLNVNVDLDKNGGVVGIEVML